MAEQEDYNVLVEKLNKKRNEYYAALARIEANNALLDRLKPVKKEVTSLKNSFNYYVMLQDEYEKESTLWEGQQYQNYLNEITDIQSENSDYYHNSLDKVLDALNNKITYLENENLAEAGLVGKLIGVINTLANKVENFFN